MGWHHNFRMGRVIMGGRTVTGKVERAVRVATRGPEEEGGS